MSSTANDDAQLKWIYEGTKSLVNREDYLLGKKIDKNFELYSDAVVADKEGGIDAVLNVRNVDGPSSSKISNLGVNIVRNEDPLIAIKMKEDSIRREKIENPLMVLKMQKLLKTEMEKYEKKQKKRKEKHEVREKQSGIASGHRNHERRKEADVTASSSASKNKYGVVKTGVPKTSQEKDERNPYDSLPRKRTAVAYEKPAKRKLTAEELEAKRREMLMNANWRDKVRDENIKKNAHRDEAEERSNSGKAATFIRPMINSAVSSTTIERQLNSHRRDLQRETEFNQQKFLKR